MAHIIKIIKTGPDQWRLEDWKKRWVQNCTSEEMNNGEATQYGNSYPFSTIWHLEKCLFNGRENYFHATWMNGYWKLHGRCIEPKRQW